MAAGYKITNANWPAGADLDDMYVPASYFQEGGLRVWGENTNAQLGDNTTANKSSPVQTIAGGTNWKQVSCGRYFSTAIKSDGTLWTWGANNLGQLGDNTIANKSSPVQTICSGANWKQSSGGITYTAAIKTDGSLWLWGSNTNGELGDNSVTHRSSPVQTVAGGTNWKQVAAGTNYTAAIKTDGTLWTWGVNGFGTLGDNTTTQKSSPVQTVAGGTNWKQVSTTGPYTVQSHIAAIKTDGTLWSWGGNGSGQLCDGSLVHKSSPVQVTGGGTNWKQVSAGYKMGAAIKTDGTLWVWGLNFFGSLGINSASSSFTSPVQTICSGSNWKQVSMGLSTSAIKTDGTLWTWGYNHVGQLGDNSQVHKSSPVQVSIGGTNWKQVSSGGYSHMVAVKYDG